jgi:hypothetical protein
LSGRPTLGVGKDLPIHQIVRWEGGSHLNHVNGREEFILEKSHYIRGCVNKNKGLILILRNPKECIVRHSKKLNSKDISWYMGLLELYDNWPSKKMVIYYEDLINSPELTLRNLTTFLNIEEDRVNEFLDNYETLFNASIGVYDNEEKTKIISGNRKRKSFSKGKDMLFHSKNFSSSQLKSFDKTITEQYPNLKRYIKKYLNVTDGLLS